MSSSQPITDSPWLWFGLFSAVGLVALIATGGKYGQRQSMLERKAQARMAVAEGSLEVSEDATGKKSIGEMPEYSQPGQTKIPLEPLAVTLSLIFAVCLVMLIREQSSRMKIPNDQ